MYEKTDRDFQKFDAEEHTGGCADAPDGPLAMGNDGFEGESLRALIEQLQGLDVDCGKYAARFNALCDYVLHEGAGGP